MARYYNFCTTRTTHFHFICIQSAFASYLPHSISHDSHSIHCPQYVPTRSTTLCFSNCQLFCHFTSPHLLQISFLLSTLWVWCLEVSCVAGTYVHSNQLFDDNFESDESRGYKLLCSEACKKIDSLHVRGNGIKWKKIKWQQTKYKIKK